MGSLLRSARRSLLRAAVMTTSFALVVGAALGACSSSGESAGFSPSADGSAGDRDACGAGCEGGLPLPSVDASVCHAADLSSWPLPSYHPASGLHQGKCTAAQIQAFYDACLEPKSSHDVCSALSTSNACAACLVSHDDAPTYGPLIVRGGLASVNIAGCIELLDPSADPNATPPRGLACAKYVQAASACEAAACAANCPVTDGKSLAAYDACVGAADMSACASFVSRASCAALEADGGDGGLGTCDPSQPFDQAFFALAPLFCGAAPSPPPPPPTDASAGD